MTVKLDVATLVAQMNEALASIHATIEGLSTSAAESDSKLDELERKRDSTLAELQAAYEQERREIAAARQKELDDIAEQRRREDEEREARRRREDEELAARKAKEDEEKQGKFDDTTRNVEDEMDNLMDSIEDEAAKTISEGEAKLAELEQRRKELNRMIEEQMKAALPPIPTRKRARTIRKTGGVSSAEPSPKPPSEEASADYEKGEESVAEGAAKPSEEPVNDEADPAPVTENNGDPPPIENGAAPEVKAKNAISDHQDEPDPESNGGEDKTSVPLEEVPADAPDGEEKNTEGDNSQPPSEEPAAERSVEEEASTEEAQSSGSTPPTEALDSRIEATTEDRTGPEEVPEDAAAPEEDPGITQPFEAQGNAETDQPANTDPDTATVEVEGDVGPEEENVAAVETRELIEEVRVGSKPTAEESAAEEEPVGSVSEKVPAADGAPAADDSLTMDEAGALTEETPLCEDSQVEASHELHANQAVPAEEDTAEDLSATKNEMDDEDNVLTKDHAVETEVSTAAEKATPEPAETVTDERQKSQEDSSFGLPVIEVTAPESPVKDEELEHSAEIEDSDISQTIEKQDNKVADGSTDGRFTPEVLSKAVVDEPVTEDAPPAGVSPQEEAGCELDEEQAVKETMIFEDTPTDVEVALDEDPSSQGVAKTEESLAREEPSKQEEALPVVEVSAAVDTITEDGDIAQKEGPAEEKAENMATEPLYNEQNEPDSVTCTAGQESSEKPNELEDVEDVAHDQVTHTMEAEPERTTADEGEVEETFKGSAQVGVSEEAGPSDASAPGDPDRDASVAQLRDIYNRRVDMVESGKVVEEGTPSADGKVQVHPDLQEIQEEVSEPPPTTQEDIEHLPTTASEDFEDGDHESRDASNLPEEQFTGGVSDPTPDDPADGASDAAADAPGDLTERTEVEERPQFSTVPEDTLYGEEVHVTDPTPDGALKDDTPATPPEDDEITAAEDQVNQNMSDALHADVPSADDYDGPEQMTAHDHQSEENDAKSFLSDGQDEEVPAELDSKASSHREDNFSNEEDDSLSHVPEETGDKQDLSIITEYTESSASSVGDDSVQATKTAEYFSPEQVSRNVSEAPKAALESSYTNEYITMAADESNSPEQHTSFFPSVSTLGQSQNPLASVKEVHFEDENENDDNQSSPVLSVREDDSDLEDVVKAYNDSLDQTGSTGYEAPAFQAQDASRNPFAKSAVDGSKGSLFNPFYRSTTDATDGFIGSASSFSENHPEYSEDSFAQSVSSHAHRQTPSVTDSFLQSTDDYEQQAAEENDNDASRNPFGRSSTPEEHSFLPTASTLEHRGLGREGSFNNPFARSSTVSGDFYAPVGEDFEPEESPRALGSTSNTSFAHSTTATLADEEFASAASEVERRQPTPQVPESMYNNPFSRSISAEQKFPPSASALGYNQLAAPRTNPFAAGGEITGRGVDESTFHQNISSVVDPNERLAGGDDSDSGLEESMNPGTHQFVQGSSPLSARHLAPTSLDSIQERYNSELEDMDSDSEESESLTTSQQLPGSQPRAPPPMPSIAERYRPEFDDPGFEDEHENLGSGIHRPGQNNTSLTSHQYKESRLSPSPPPHALSSHGVYNQDVEDSSDNEDDAFDLDIARPTQANLLSSSQYGATPPPPPPPHVTSSQEYHHQQLEEPSEEEKRTWGDAFTPAQLINLPTSHYAATASSPPQPPRAPSSLSQNRYQVEDADEEEQGVLPSKIPQHNLPSALSISDHQAIPPPPPPPRAPSSQGFHHQEQTYSSEEETPYTHEIARPGQFPISSSSQCSATPPPPPPQLVPSSQWHRRVDLEDSNDEEDACDSNAARPAHMQNLSTSHFRAAPSSTSPPRAPSALDRHGHELEDSDSEENEEVQDSEANTYGQKTIMDTSSLLETSSIFVDPMRPASSPRSMTPTAEISPKQSAFKESAPVASSPGLHAHQREDEEEESGDSWDNIHQRGEAIDSEGSGPGFAAPTPQLRVESFERQWPNASNDQISTASTYLAPNGPGDFTDTELHEYATPLASAGFSASSQDTHGARDSLEHSETIESASTEDNIDEETFNPGTANSPQTQSMSLAQELGEDDDSDAEDVYDHSQAPAFLTQIGTTQQQHANESAAEQMIDSSLTDSDDGSSPVIVSSSETPAAQHASSRFGATTWRDELRSPTLFGATRHSRSGSLREELQKSLRQETEAGHHAQVHSEQRQPEFHAQEAYDAYESQEAQVHSQSAQIYGQQTYAEPLHSPEYIQQTSVQQPFGNQTVQAYEQDPYAQQQYGQVQYGTESYGQVEYVHEQTLGHYGQPSFGQPEVQVTEIHEEHEKEKEKEKEADELRDESGEQVEEEETEQTTPNMKPKASEQTPGISSLALRQDSPATPSSRGTPSRGLAFSRHNPDRPQTPPSQPAQEEENFDPEAFVPRDVTNVPWHARSDSVPYSMRSQSTLESVASSPVHSALHADKHEPVIRDSWPASVHNLTRPRNDSSLTDRSDYDPFKYEGGNKTLHGATASVGSSSDSPPRNPGSKNTSPGSLISRMRGIFENTQAKQEPTSPVRSRPVSGVFHPVRRAKPGGEGDNPGSERKAGFLNEAEDEVDEQSALLRNSAGGLEAN
ncbi:hypothetical protein CCHL11_10011 [Colletotrichum chlorophyti]|uniref:Uncharacterized protein n=1 Tax=Colletotrichum chlorophyti TaxID=708187 RepID=A0A1Q8RA99_9PEZI|nr:hypothetical protein CCHL11_10011 [Colletotrichum chlorophyti]